jgi:hypothetical protein
METEAHVLVTLAIVAFVAACAAALVFGTDRRGAPGYKILPASSAEWMAYWFHTLEFTLICGSFAALMGSADNGPLWMQRALLWGVCGSALLLLISTIVFWRFDRQLCHRAFDYFFLLCIGVLLAGMII